MIGRVGVFGMLLGTLTAAYSAWYIVRGPFFGYPIPSRWLLLAACGTFIIGTVVFALGLNIVTGLRTSERPDIDEHHDHTMDWIQR